MHTAIGRLFEALANQTYDSPNNTNEIELSQAIRLILTNDVPHYVTDEKVLKLIGSEKVQRGFAAMVRAGIRGLPFDPILIEFRDPAHIFGATSFVRLQSKPLRPLQLTMRESIRGDIYGYPVALSDDPRFEKGVGYIISTLASDDPVIVDFDAPEDRPDQPYVVYVGHGKTDIDEKGKQQLGLDVAEAMSIAMLMLNTRGIEKVHVDTGRLNKARAKGSVKKPPIPSYTVIQIGHVYDRHGNAHSVSGTGRTMPVHWRAGHIRQQRVGPRVGRKEDRPVKPVFIHPILVNFEGEGPIPVPKHEVKL